MADIQPIRQIEIKNIEGSEFTPFGVEAKNVEIPVDEETATTLQSKANEWDTKLRAVAGAQPNVIESISVNGATLPIENKNVEIGNAGHIITNQTGVSMPKRDKLQFKNLKVLDDTTVRATVVVGPTFSVEEEKEIGTLKITF